MGTVPKLVPSGRVLMHNHVRHSRRERLPGVDRQHAAAARFQALQVRLGWPAALQQDSRLQVRVAIDASALGRFPRRILDLPVTAAKLLGPLWP